MTYNAVIIPENGDPFVVQKNSVDELVTVLREYYSTDTKVFVFYGDYWGITKGPIHRYLVNPDGGRYPLFPDEPEMEIDPEGSLSTR